jgi:hypothetical protein
MSNKFINFLELVLLLGVTQWPLFVFAGKIDGDEMVKFISSATSGASAIGIYKVWKGYQQKKCNHKDHSK